MSRDDLERLRDVVDRGGVLVVSGAGMSTESGIPDYRGPRPAGTQRPDPMTWAQFRDSEAARCRYWARSHAGWPRFRDVSPNRGHRAVARLEELGLLAGVITQNVDGLHQRAGSREVLDMHGRLDRVVCLTCGAVSPRDVVQERLSEANAGWRPQPGRAMPDGDVALEDPDSRTFDLVGCERCGGTLKPDVVFFGESIPAARNRHADALVDRARSVLVLGSSLTVFSGRRLVLRAARAGRPVTIVNRGATRADDLATVRVDAALGPTLVDLLDRSTAAAPAHPNR